MPRGRNLNDPAIVRSNIPGTAISCGTPPGTVRAAVRPPSAVPSTSLREGGMLAALGAGGVLVHPGLEAPGGEPGDGQSQEAEAGRGGEGQGGGSHGRVEVALDHLEGDAEIPVQLPEGRGRLLL